MGYMTDDTFYDDLECMDREYVTDDDYAFDCDAIKVKEYVDCYDYYANYGTMYVEKPPRYYTYRGVYI